jgi:hypothetical protein
VSTDFDTLPPAISDPHADDEDTTIPDGPICETCNKTIIREPGKRGRAPKYHPECRPSAKKTGSRKRRPAKASGPDYEEGLNGIFQMVSFGLTMAGDKSKPLLADGLALSEHGPNISAALNQLALEKPEIAGVLDKVLAAGPYGLLLAAVAPLAMQIVSNHGVVVPGVRGADAYLAGFTQGLSEAA